MGWEADEQDTVSPRGFRRLLRGSEKPRKALGCALQSCHTPPNKEHPSPGAEGPEGHRVVTLWRQSLDPLGAARARQAFKTEVRKRPELSRAGFSPPPPPCGSSVHFLPGLCPVTRALAVTLLVPRGE